MSKVRVRQLQLAFFLENISLTDKLDIAKIFIEASGESLSGEPTILPIPNDAPFAIPRIILSSPDKTFVCNISPVRVDFIINLTNPQVSEELKKKIEDDLLSYVKSFNKIILTHLKWKINRLAYIKNVELDIKGGVIQNISSKLTKDIGENATELQIHKMQTVKINKVTCNHWVRIISENPGEENEKIVILSDINTRQNEFKDPKQDDSTQFFIEAVKYTDEVIANIF